MGSEVPEILNRFSGSPRSLEGEKLDAARTAGVQTTTFEPNKRSCQAIPACTKMAVLNAQSAAAPDRFSTTRWSMVLSCADSKITSVAARNALSELCRIYWRPIFAYICRRGYSVED